MACQTQGDTTRSTATATPFVAPAPDATATEPAPTATPTATPEPTVTATATTVAPTVTPAPGAPLSETGPWLLYEEYFFTNEEQEPLFISKFHLSNIDGSGLTALEQIPPPEAGIPDEVRLGSSFGRLVSAVTVTNAPPGQRTNTLYIWELPTQRVVGQFAFTSPRERVAYGPNLHSLDWSPDGRWLAFMVEHKNATLDLYLLDTTTGESQPVVEGMAA